MTFEEWWREAGSGISPNHYDDCESHTHKVAAIAWNAALLVAANKCYASDGWDMHPKDYGKLVASCLVVTPNSDIEGKDNVPG